MSRVSLGLESFQNFHRGRRRKIVNPPMDFTLVHNNPTARFSFQVRSDVLFVSYAKHVLNMFYVLMRTKTVVVPVSI